MKNPGGGTSACPRTTKSSRSLLTTSEATTFSCAVPTASSDSVVYRTWIEEDDVVVAEPWDWQDEKATIEWRYTNQDATQLRREGHID